MLFCVDQTAKFVICRESFIFCWLAWKGVVQRAEISNERFLKRNTTVSDKPKTVQPWVVMVC